MMFFKECVGVTGRAPRGVFVWKGACVVNVLLTGAPRGVVVWYGAVMDDGAVRFGPVAPPRGVFVANGADNFRDGVADGVDARGVIWAYGALTCTALVGLLSGTQTPFSEPPYFVLVTEIPRRGKSSAHRDDAGAELHRLPTCTAVAPSNVAPSHEVGERALDGGAHTPCERPLLGLRPRAMEVGSSWQMGFVLSNAPTLRPVVRVDGDETLSSGRGTDVLCDIFGVIGCWRSLAKGSL